MKHRCPTCLKQVYSKDLSRTSLCAACQTNRMVTRNDLDRAGNRVTAINNQNETSGQLDALESIVENLAAGLKT